METIIRKSREFEWIAIPWSLLVNKKLSTDARIAAMYLIGREDRTITPGHLKFLNEGWGRDKVYSILNELTLQGYCQRIEERNPNGTVRYVVYEFSCQPLPAQPETANPEVASIDTTTRDTLEGGGGAGGGGKRKKPSIPMPDDWQPDADRLARIRQRYPTVDTADELESYRLHAQATGRRLADWNAGFEQWCRRAVQFRKHSVHHAGRPAGQDQRSPDAVAQRNRDRVRSAAGS